MCTKIVIDSSNSINKKKSFRRCSYEAGINHRQFIKNVSIHKTDWPSIGSEIRPRERGMPIIKPGSFYSNHVFKARSVYGQKQRLVKFCFGPRLWAEARQHKLCVPHLCGRILNFQGVTQINLSIAPIWFVFEICYSG